MNVVNFSEVRTFSSATIYALQAAKEALQDAKWEPSSLDEGGDRTGVAIGMAITDLEYIIDTGTAFRTEGYKKVSPFFVPRILTNMASGAISLRYRFRGPNHSVATACATGINAIGDAFQFIRYGKADVMVCGGTEGLISPLSIAGFSRMRALSTKFNSEPSRASRPFEKHRDGFVIGEGSAVIVLEELEHARKRNARIYAEILGYGLAADAYHITAASEDGAGAYLCMRAALRDAGIRPEDVGHINVHATSTPIGDVAEVVAMKRLFEYGKNFPNDRQLPLVCATKSSTGHLLGAAGAIETVFTILAVDNGEIPPTLNFEEPDDKCIGLQVSSTKTKWDQRGRRVALNNSFGFGGTNATLVIAQCK
ncbi:3-oxoacyl-[acyl-carrier-protein] synthase, mitochondrial-like isoform X2 [Varroa jacobsoni]|nr:3-oxoacyl-[acyl-carrier-protein] synthase, mitochondrial-like isoform X2 [Varroa jacobsoni]